MSSHAPVATQSTMACTSRLHSNRSFSMVARPGPGGRRGYAPRMTMREFRRVLRAGDCAAVALPPGPVWLPLLQHARNVGAAVLPIDVRLTGPERAAPLATAQPTVITDSEGVRRADGVPIDPEIALVIATSGTSGHPR